jgi:hypothetical protein
MGNVGIVVVALGLALSAAWTGLLGFGAYQIIINLL